MAFDEGLAERVRERLARQRNIEEKKMFGGVGFLLNGNLLVGILEDSLVVRLDPAEGEDALREPNVSVFDFTGRAMRGWVVVAPEGIEEDEQLMEWLERARAFVQTLPAK